MVVGLPPVAEKVALEAPPDTVILAGTLSAGLSLARDIVVAAVAVLPSVTVQVLAAPAAMVVGAQASELKVTADACTVTATLMETLPSVAVTLAV